MKGKILRQCKKVILENNKTERDIKLSLSDKCHMKTLSKKIKEEGNIDGISFEEFVLLCKYYKIKATIRIENGYVTRFYDLLQFDMYSLSHILNKCLSDVIMNDDESKFPQISIVMFYSHYIQDSKVILFEQFMILCKKLNIKVNIE
jgi:hypothetical protein